MNEALAAEEAAVTAARPSAEISLTLGRIRSRVGRAEEAEENLRTALELAKKERNWACERTAEYELGTLYVSARSPPEHAEAVKHLSKSWESHMEGKGKKDQIEHMKVGNALAQSLRRLRRHKEAAEIFMAVTRLRMPNPEERYENSRCAMWKENRPATAVSDTRVWSGVTFQETTAAQVSIRKKPVKPLEKSELYATLRSQTPDVFRFSTWGDPNDERPPTREGDRTRAMKRYEEDASRELKERIQRRKEAGLPPL